MHIYVYIHTRIYTPIHIYIYTPTHTYVCISIPDHQEFRRSHACIGLGTCSEDLSLSRQAINSHR